MIPTVEFCKELQEQERTLYEMVGGMILGGIRGSYIRDRANVCHRDGGEPLWPTEAALNFLILTTFQEILKGFLKTLKNVANDHQTTMKD